MEDSPAAPPRRRPRPPRRPERQQILLRRGLALGAGLIVAILLVLGVKGCLDARANRALSDYSRNVTQIVDETQQTSKAFFGKLSDPGSLSVTEFVAEVNADRSAMDNYVTRVDSLSAPGDMGHAQNALELVYELRGSAMTEIANKMSTALGNVGSAQATAVIAKPDAEAAGRRRPLRDGGAAGNRRRARQQRDRRQRRAEERLPARRDQVARPDRGQRGAGLGQRLERHGDPGRARAGPDRGQRQRNRTEPRNRPRRSPRKARRKSKSRSRTRANRPRTASPSRSKSTADTLQQDINSIGAGETESVTIPLTPAPKGETTLEVEVETVPGEQVSSNNKASYTVNFE